MTIHERGKVNYDQSLLDGVLRHIQQYFSCIMAVSFIGGGNKTKPMTFRKSLTNFIT